jgi:long-chain acyl-CoA synthetase
VDGSLSLATLAPRMGTLRQLGRSWSRAEIEAEAGRLREAVAAIAGPGEIIDVPAPDPATALAWLEASWREGRVPSPRAHVKTPAKASAVDPIPDAALVIRTSGSTGEAKLVAFDGASVERSATKIARYLGLDASDRVGILQSLEHGYGLIGQLFSALAGGSEIVWAGAPFARERVRLLDEGAVTVLAGVPYTLGELASAGLRGERLRSIGSAGGALGPSVLTSLKRAFPHAVLWNQYGCTEAGPRLTACSSSDAAFAEGSVGRAIEGVELSVDDTGEILFRADTEMLRYAGDPVATASARRGALLATGDLGRLEGGYLYVTGRRDDVVKVRGHKVSLAFVAQVAERCGARAAVAVAVEHQRGGDELEVVVVYEGDADLERIALAKQLPLESAPSRLVRVEGLPRLGGGKVDRRAAADVARGERG